MHVTSNEHYFQDRLVSDLQNAGAFAGKISEICSTYPSSQ